MRDLRLAMGIRSQAALARRAPGLLRQDTVSRVEAGKNKASDEQTRRGLAQAFGLTLDLLDAYLGGTLPLVVAMRAAADADAPALALVAKGDAAADAPADVALERALARAFDPDAHELRDVDAVRRALRGARTSLLEVPDLQHAARVWLDLAVGLRAAGRPVTIETMMVALTPSAAPSR